MRDGGCIKGEAGKTFNYFPSAEWSLTLQHFPLQETTVWSCSKMYSAHSSIVVHFLIRGTRLKGLVPPLILNQLPVCCGWEWRGGDVSMLSNLSLFYQQLLLIAFNSTLIAELFPHKHDNIIRGVWVLPAMNWQWTVRTMIFPLRTGLTSSNIGQIIHKSGTDWPNMFQTTVRGL